MNVSKALYDVENSIRNLIADKLSKSDPNWVNKLEISADKILKWEERKVVDFKRTGVVNNNILYYADFYDLPIILKKHWSTHFAAVFGELKEFELLWKILESYRNSEAHKRDLMPYQEHLVLGISGKIRTDITSYFSKMDTGESYYARIESVQDSLGNCWNRGANKEITLYTGSTLRPGHVLEFTTTAFDPQGEPLYYKLSNSSGVESGEWTVASSGKIEIAESDIRKKFFVYISIKNNRKHQAHIDYEDSVSFCYTVIPG